MHQLYPYVIGGYYERKCYGHLPFVLGAIYCCCPDIFDNV